MTQLSIQGSSWQQPKLASSGPMKYLWCWSCHCLEFYSLSPASFSIAASPRYGVLCWGRRFLSPEATLPAPPPTPSCLAALPHSCLHTHRLGLNILLSIIANGGAESAKPSPPPHPHSDHKETGALCYSLLTTNNSGLSTGRLAETGFEVP